MVCRADMFNAMGTVHGGVICDLADVAMGVAVASILDGASSFSTTELQARFLKPVREGTLIASAGLIRRGCRVVHVACEVRHDRDLIATVTSSCLIEERP